MGNYILSNYVVDVVVKGEKYIYNTLSGEYSLSDELLENDDRFYIDSEKKEFTDLFSSCMEIRENSDFLCITLVLTKKCNFHCSYCFEKEEENSLDTVETISFLLKYINEYKKRYTKLKNIVIFWFGGEPMLKLETMLEIGGNLKNHCSKLNLSFTSRIITNGYLLENLIPYIDVLNITDIQVTIDGIQPIHDARRKLKNGNGTFKKIVENLKLLNGSVDLIIRMNVDKKNIKIVKDLYYFIKESHLCSNVSMFFQPMMVDDFGGQSECYSYNGKTDQGFINKYNEILSDLNILEDVKFINAYCNVDFPGAIVINSDGLIYKCWASIENKSFSFGSIKDDTNILIDKIIFNKFQVKCNECVSCKYYPACLGGCKYQKYSKRNCICIINDIRNRITTKILNEIE